MDYELMMNGNVKIGQKATDFEATTTGAICPILTLPFIINS